MRRIAWLAAALIVAAPGRAEDRGGTVGLESLTYAQLADAVAGLKGKVILVDLWGEFCVPCKKEFPHFVALHRKYGASGLAALSVSLDDPTDADAKERVREFLIAQKATCRNVLLAEKPEVWQEKWKIVGPPCIFLFDRNGRLINRWADKEIDFEAIEQRVADLLK